MTFRQFIFIYLGKLLHKLSISSSYFNYYLPLCLLIERLSERKYRLSTYKDSLAIKGENDFAGFFFLLRPGTTDLNVFDQVITYGEYIPLIKLVSSCNQTENIKTIVDAGANIGLSTIFFKSHFSSSKIVCVEPDCSNCDQLIRNIKINDTENTVSILQKALWSNEWEDLYIKNDFRGGGSWSKSVLKSEEFMSSELQVSAVNVESIIERFGWKYIDILKMDIEGAEFELFGSDDFILILKNKVKFIAIEIHDELGERSLIEDKLNENGFEMSRVGETNFGFNKNI